MKQFLFVLFLLLLHTNIPSHAQDVSAWPPDPEAIFAPGVEIIETEIIQEAPDTRPQFDNEARVIRLYNEDTSTWREYPYPDEVESFSGIDPYEGELLLLTTVRNRGPYSTGADPTGQWLLNTMTGEFSRPELMCGELRARADEGRWIVYYEDSQTKQPELCNTETGERSRVHIENDNLRDVPVEVSPDNARAVLFGYSGIYVYDLETKAILRLGDIQASDIHSATWLGSEQLLIYETNQADMSFPWQFYSLGNVNQENSLHVVDVVFKPFSITTREHPFRYEWVEYRNKKCYLVQMHKDGKRDEYPLEDLCQDGVILDQDDDRLYSPVRTEPTEYENSWRPVSRDLVRYNPYTGERHDLYSGEVEFVMDISADGRYAVIVLDNNGQLDMFRLDDVQNLDIEDRPINFRLAIISLETGNILYEVPTDAESSRFSDFWYVRYDATDGAIHDAFATAMRAYPLSSLFNIGSDRFILREREHDTLIELSGTQVAEVPIARALLVLTGSDRLVTFSHDVDRRAGSIMIYNVLTRELNVVIPTVNQSSGDGPLTTEGYAVGFDRGNTPDSVQVLVTNSSTHERMRYFVRVP